MTTVSAGEPNRVLVVDDERAITDLVAMALKYEGFSVQTAGTAKQARHAVMDFRPDLMILDVGLPDEDGFTLVQRLITAAGLTVTLLLAGVTFATGHGGGLYWLPVSFVLAIAIAAVNAWVLLVEVLR